MADGRPGPTRRGPTPAPDSTLLNQIFPNHDDGRRPDAASTPDQHAGPDQRTATGAHRRVDRAGPGLRISRRLRPSAIRQAGAGVLDVAASTGWRRRVLFGLGGAAAVATGAGVTALVTGDATPAEASSRRHNTRVEGLGAAGIVESATEAARVAAGATPTWPTPLARDPHLHLLRRATFGPTVGDIAAIRQVGLDAWLDRQLDPNTIADPTGDEIARLYRTIGMTSDQIRATVKRYDWEAMWELGHATIARQVWSSRQLFEVMVDFWANHLNVTNPFDGGWDVRTSYDNDVIRAHALGDFSSMLAASARHPAMMRYLDNASSHRDSVNENYGRELLELHTVGVEARYTEKDVRHSAFLMTGRTVDDGGRFRYDPDRHWTGAVRVLGFTHPNGKRSQGLGVGDAYLTYLATHPATATRIARKLARRFVCDDPPQTLVDRLAQSYLDNGTAIKPMLHTLFRSLEFWMSTGLKTRRPLENLVATGRVLGVAPGPKTRDGVEGLYRMADQLGQAPLTWGPPDGFADVADAWGSAHATLGTWNAHRRLINGRLEGLSYPSAASLVGRKPANVGAYLDTLATRLVHQPMATAHKKALLKFLGAKTTTAVKSTQLGGAVDDLVPLMLDSVYHALR